MNQWLFAFDHYQHKSYVKTLFSTIVAAAAAAAALSTASNLYAMLHLIKSTTIHHYNERSALQGTTMWILIIKVMLYATMATDVVSLDEFIISRIEQIDAVPSVMD